MVNAKWSESLNELSRLLDQYQAASKQSYPEWSDSHTIVRELNLSTDLKDYVEHIS